jgi:hypothetical protein
VVVSGAAQDPAEIQAVARLLVGVGPFGVRAFLDQAECGDRRRPGRVKVAKRGIQDDVEEAAVRRDWDRYAELSALLKDDALASLNALRYFRPTTRPERLKQI